jgi:hypothetical protein
MTKLVREKRFISSKKKPEVHAILKTHVEEIEEFTIISKLSAGGAVVRTLRAPKSEKKFFGQCIEEIRIAELRYKRNLTPYQPILRITLHNHDEGCEIFLHCAPHPKMFEFGLLYNIAGVLLLLGTIPMIVQRPEMAAISGFFGLLLLVYPRFRARISFDEACSSAVQTFVSLPLNIKKD